MLPTHFELFQNLMTPEEQSEFAIAFHEYTESQSGNF